MRGARHHGPDPTQNPVMPALAQTPGAPTSRAIRLRLVGLDGPAVAVCVRAGQHSTWAEIRDAMRACGLTVPDRLYAGRDAVPDSTCLGQHPLCNGVQLSPAPTAADEPHLLDLVVTEGPEVGARIALGARVQRVGRAPSNSLVLRDPGLSRTHLVVGVDQGRAMVSDAGSTNGSRIDGHRVAPEKPVELRAGQRLRAGATTIALERALPSAEPLAMDDSCRIPFQRAPRVPLRLNSTTLERPTPPSKPDRQRVPWPLIVLPMLVAVCMVLLLHNAMFLMFGLLGPVMMVGQHLSDRQGGASRVRQQRAEHAAALQRLAETRHEASIDELTTRRRITPPISDALRAAATRDARLWARSPTHDDYLSCRVGVGTIPSLIQVRGGSSPPESVMLSEAPIALCLNDSRIIGVTGEPRHRLRLVHGLLLQLAAWQSPRFLRLVVVCDAAASRAHWDWAADLPHVTPGPHSASTINDLETDESSCQTLLSKLLPEPDDHPSIGDHARCPVATVVVLDGWDTLGKRPEVTELLAATERGAVAVIAIGNSAGLPAECEVSIDVRSSTSVVVNGTVEASGCPDLPRSDLCHEVARLLARTSDATPDVDAGTTPDRAALLDVWRADGCAPPSPRTSSGTGPHSAGPPWSLSASAQRARYDWTWRPTGRTPSSPAPPAPASPSCCRVW